MAALTFTASQAQPSFPVKFLDSVTDTVIMGKYIENATSLSKGDIIWIAKVPHGAVITGYQVYVQGGNDTSALYQLQMLVGTTTTVISTTFSQSATASYRNDAGGIGANLPFMVSVSDDSQTKWGFLEILQLCGTSTTTGTFKVILRVTKSGTPGDPYGP